MAYLKQVQAGSLALILILSLSGGTQIGSAENIDESFREASIKTNTNDFRKPKSTKLLEAYYASKLDTMGINLRPGSEHTENDNPTELSSRKCKSVVYQTLTNLPAEHVKELKKLTLFYNTQGRRGLGGNGAIVLRCLNVGDNELAAVLTHEIGHLVDSGYLRSEKSADKSAFLDFENPVFNDDPSSNFYKISWNSEKEMKIGAKELDFVSLYAMTDPFEDFAETYTYYKLHGEEFAELANHNDSLKQKYEFMKDEVFGGKEFQGTAQYVKYLDFSRRNYDVTVLPY